MMNDVHVVSLGARTPVGLNAASSAAAVRAGISRVREHPYFGDPIGDPVRGAFDGRLDPNLQGVARLAGLLVPALREALQPLLGLVASASGVLTYLSVPEHRPGFSARDEQLLVAQLRSAIGVPLDVQVVERGHAGGLHGIALAAEQLASGRFELCVVASVDSYFDADGIEWLITNDQLAFSESRSSFLPGEAAAAIALAASSLIARHRLPTLARVKGGFSARETNLIKTDAINQGHGLTTAITRATAGLRLPEESIDDVWCDINGERYRADEWTFVLLRLPHVFRRRTGPTTYLTAVDSWGDVGAATGVLLSILAVRAWERHYASGPNALLFGGSEQGLRSAVVLRGR